MGGTQNGVTLRGSFVGNEAERSFRQSEKEKGNLEISSPRLCELDYAYLENNI